MKKIFQISLIIASIFALSSCDKKYDDITSDDGFKGVFVRNEAGSISYYNQKDKTVNTGIYNTVNGVSLASPLTAFVWQGEKGYLLMGNPSKQKIEIIDTKTFKSKGVAKDNLSNVNDLKAVSQSFVALAQGVSGDVNAGSVVLLNSQDLSIISATIKVGKNPTKLAYNRGKKMYVANTGGVGYPDSTVMVIDIDLKTVVDTIVLEEQVDELITLRLKKPIDIILDAYQNLWVLCAGDAGEGVGLAKINYGTSKVSVFPFENGNLGNGKNNLCTSASGTFIYFMKDGLYRMGINATELPTERYLKGGESNTVFDAIAVDPYTGKFYCAKEGNNGSNGEVYIFDKLGTIISDAKFIVGVAPRQFVFVR